MEIKAGGGEQRGLSTDSMLLKRTWELQQAMVDQQLHCYCRSQLRKMIGAWGELKSRIQNRVGRGAGALGARGRLGRGAPKSGAPCWGAGRCQIWGVLLFKRGVSCYWSRISIVQVFRDMSSHAASRAGAAHVCALARRAYARTRYCTGAARGAGTQFLSMLALCSGQPCGKIGQGVNRGW